MVAKKFTILELLLVIAVIVILASLLLPALRNARDTARTIGCLSNQKQVGIGLAMYANDYSSWIPLGSGIYTSQEHGPWSEFVVDGNYSSWDVMHCPATTLGPKKGIVQWTMGAYTYGMRYYTLFFSKAAYYNIATMKDSEGLHISQSPSNYPLIADSAKLIGVNNWQSYLLDSGKRVHIRHRKGANLFFTDGHAEFKSAMQIENSDYGISFEICYTPNP